MVPIRDIDVGVLIDKASVRGAERRPGDLFRVYIVFGPLGFLRVVSQEGYRDVVAIKDRGASLQL